MGSSHEKVRGRKSADTHPVRAGLKVFIVVTI